MSLQNAPVSAHIERLKKLGWKGLKKEPDLKAVEVDHELAYLLDWYKRLRRQARREENIQPIEHKNIEAFDRLNRCDMDEFDLDTLEKLDAVWSNCIPKRS